MSHLTKTVKIAVVLIVVIAAVWYITKDKSSTATENADALARLSRDPPRKPVTVSLPAFGFTKTY